MTLRPPDDHDSDEHLLAQTAAGNAQAFGALYRRRQAQVFRFALHMTGSFKLPVASIALIFLLKSVASMASLGSGFRGGLFFASLLLGSLGGQLFAAALNAAGIAADPASPGSFASPGGFEGASAAISLSSVPL